MATSINILQAPDSLSLLGNIRKYILSTSDTARFKLMQGSSVIVDEGYRAINGTIEIDIQEVLRNSLSYSIPSSDIYLQSNIVKTFTLYLGDDMVNAAQVFTVIQTGVYASAVIASTFLAANWLTWQPQEKRVRRLQPEWLTYYHTVAGTVIARFYSPGGQTTDIVIQASAAAGSCYSYNMQLAHLLSLTGVPANAYGYVDVWVENSSGTRLSYIQRYIYSPDEEGDEFFLAINSLGGIDSFCFNGESVLSPEIEYESAEYEEALEQSAILAKRFTSKNTGYNLPSYTKWIWEFFNSTGKYIYRDSALRSIVIDSSSISDNSTENLNAFEFKYRIAADKGLLNYSRSTEALPTTITITLPDQELFFLEARLIDLPEGTLESTVLFPIQSPFAQNWSRISWGAVDSLIMGQVNDNIALALQVLGGYVLRSEFSTAINNIATLIETINESIIESALELFEKVNIGTEEEPQYVIRAKYGLYSEGFIASGGPAEAGSGSGGTSYDRLDSWGNYVSAAQVADDDTLVSTEGYVLSALLGYDLHTRLNTLTETVENLDLTLTSTAVIEALGYTPANVNNVRTLTINGNTVNGTAAILGTYDPFGAANTTIAVTYEDIVPEVQRNVLSMLSVIDGRLCVTGNFYATGSVASGGADGGSGSGSSGGTSYNRLDNWADYTADKGAYVLSALLGYDLHTRLNTLTETVENLDLTLTSAAVIEALGYTPANVNNARTLTINGNTVNGTAAVLGTYDPFGNANTTLAITYEDIVPEVQRNVLSMLSVIDGRLCVTGNFYATGSVASGGPDSGSGSSGGTSYNRLDNWLDYTSDKGVYVLSALLGNDLHTRLTDVEQGYVASTAVRTIAVVSEYPETEDPDTLYIQTGAAATPTVEGINCYAYSSIDSLNPSDTDSNNCFNAYATKQIYLRVKNIAGGTTGQVLKKLSDDDYDYVWGTAGSTGSWGSPSSGFVLLKLSESDSGQTVALSGHTHSSATNAMYLVNGVGTQYPVSSFALAGHTHSGYMANTKSAIEAVLTGTITSHNHSGVYAPLSHTHSNYLTAVTKTAVEAVLTGDITTHTHSQYITGVTKSAIEAVLTGTITSHDHSGVYAPVAHTHSYHPLYGDSTVDFAAKAITATSISIGGYLISVVSGKLNITGPVSISGNLAVTGQVASGS